MTNVTLTTEQAQQIEESVCNWRQPTYDNFDANYWDTDCGKSWAITEGTPKDNGMKFCHGCGKPIKEHPFVDSEETEMNNDRELLEQAAKAAGYDYECTAHTGYPEHDQHQIRSEFGTLVDWNPLTDDGDALRLAVKLGLWIHIGKYHVAVEGTRIEENCGDDPYAATRRAIVRAAAEIGKEQK